MCLQVSLIRGTEMSLYNYTLLLWSWNTVMAIKDKMAIVVTCNIITDSGS